MLQVWKKGLAPVTIIMLMAVLLLGPWAVAPASAQEQQLTKNDNTYRIVSLGDSLTVGYEPGMDINWKPYGFVDRLLEQGLYHSRTEVVNLGINGLKTDGLHQYVQAIFDERAISANDIQSELKDPRAAIIGSEAAQAKTLIAGADVITVTIGGNDMLELVMTADTLSTEELKTRVEQVLKVYSDNVTAAVNNLHSINPDAVIVLADQYQPIPKIADKVVYPKLLEAAEQFTKLIDGMTESFNKNGITVKVAHVAKEFVGSEMTMTHILKEDIHPNQYGYEVMARVFSETIWGGYTKPVVYEAEQPMGIIVSGKEIKTPYKPVMVKNQNFVAIQDIVNAIGAESKWSNKTSSATITYGDKEVVIKIGSKSVKVNGTPVSIDTPAFLHKVGKEQKTYVPLAVLASGLGFDVQYNPKLRTVFINP
ncbi:stalk domain-containing protein [Paenibacillus sp. N3/727]|uniref:stalk domain-containing protein n=1 Tax=Paenibacillus sp. N3/727 TaxID=2925845 RepID=UPI001F5369A0|nr:stalk domain-containing protein [Paenibacillus sp. N3/727]UNK19265.1 stalk domain-containing protein [Paenibacillus sp. N3/727]